MAASATRTATAATRSRRRADVTEVPDFHVLALSGGGYRALYTATVLTELEAAMGRPIASHFDLVCGTSAGGLLALGLAADIPAVELKTLFEKQGSRIFGSRTWLRRALGFWLQAKHSSAGLREVLTERFGDTTVGDLKHRVLVPAVNYTTGRGQFFKTPHHQTFEFDHRMSLVDVAMATAAAPVYFPLARNNRGVFADGGLVGNAPGLFGLHEVRTFLAPKQDVRVRVLSIGTMTIGATLRARRGSSARVDHGAAPGCAVEAGHTFRAPISIALIFKISFWPWLSRSACAPRKCALAPRRQCCCSRRSPMC